MAHFAQLDKNNTVIKVIVINNEALLNESNNEIEQKGIDLCVELFDGEWIQTSYNGNIRKNYAGIGYTYDPIRDAFIPPKPKEGNWELDEETCRWIEIAP